MTTIELLKTFPEAKEIIPQALQHWENEAVKLWNNETKPLFELIDKLLVKDWYWRKVYYHFSPRRKYIWSQIKRLKKLNKLIKEPSLKTGYARQADYKERTLATPIGDLYDFEGLHKSYDGHRACCPFHDGDNETSFRIFKDNKFKCYACGEYGDSIDFIMKLYGCTYNEAIRRGTN